MLPSSLRYAVSVTTWIARSAWVLLTLVSGCYLSHTRGGPDARADVDASVADARGRDAPLDDAFVAPTCELVSPDEWIVPSATLGGEFTTEIPIGMRFHSGGCSCTPRPFDEGGRIGGELCDCCEECDCLPPSYELTLVHTETAGITRFTPVAPNGSTGPTIEVVDWALPCAPIPEPADLVEVVLPDGIAIPGRPVGVWAHVRGVHFRCSGPVLPLVATRGAGIPPVFVMEDCSPDIDPCGPITPTPYETHAFLGFFEPGAHRVSAFGTEVEFTVP